MWEGIMVLRLFPGTNSACYYYQWEDSTSGRDNKSRDQICLMLAQVTIINVILSSLIYAAEIAVSVGRETKHYITLWFCVVESLRIMNMFILKERYLYMPFRSHLKLDMSLYVPINRASCYEGIHVASLLFVQDFTFSYSLDLILGCLYV